MSLLCCVGGRPGRYGTIPRQRFYGLARIGRAVLTVRARTPVHPSEDPQKVRRALLTVFPNAQVTEGAGWIEAAADNLEPMRLLIRKQKILDASRKSLLRGLEADGDHAVFLLSKQAAAAGRLSFALNGAPLGDIVVHVEGRDLERQFKEMAPMTLRGIPVSEEQAERHLEKVRKRAAAPPKPTADLAEEFEAPWEDEA